MEHFEQLSKKNVSSACAVLFKTSYIIYPLLGCYSIARLQPILRAVIIGGQLRTGVNIPQMVNQLVSLRPV